MYINLLSWLYPPLVLTKVAYILYAWLTNIKVDPIMLSLDYYILNFDRDYKFYPLDENYILENIYGEIYLDEDRISFLNFSILDGTYPQNKDGVALTKLHFLNFTKFGFADFFFF